MSDAIRQTTNASTVCAIVCAQILEGGENAWRENWRMALVLAMKFLDLVRRMAWTEAMSLQTDLTLDSSMCAAGKTSKIRVTVGSHWYVCGVCNTPELSVSLYLPGLQVLD